MSILSCIMVHGLSDYSVRSVYIVHLSDVIYGLIHAFWSHTHRFITLRNGIGNAIHCQSIIIVSLAYDIIMTCFIEMDMDSLNERKSLIAITVCCYKMMY